MSTPGGLGMAIGKGVQVGSDRYLSGIEKINAAKEKFAEARDRMEDLRISRDDMNAKEIRQAERGVREARMKGQELFYNGAVNDLNMSQKNISAVFGAAANALNTDKEIASREKISKAQIAASGRNSQLELLQAVQKDPKLADAYRALHGKGVDVMGEFNDYLKANPMLAADPKAAMTQFLMTKAVFSQLGSGTVTDKPSTKLRTQP